MENASKALMIAGAILIAVLIISLFMWFLVQFRDYTDALSSAKMSTDAEAYNRFFVYAQPPDRIVRGYELYNIVGKAIDYNARRVGNEGIITAIVPGAPINQTEILSGAASIDDVFGIYKDGARKNWRYEYTYNYGSDGRINQINFNLVGNGG